jgi:stage II sporulation protein P
VKVLYLRSRIIPIVVAAIIGLALALSMYPWISLLDPVAVPVYSEPVSGSGLGPLLVASERSETDGSMLWMLMIKGALPAYAALGERHYLVELLAYATERIRNNEPHRILAMGVSGLSQVPYAPVDTDITITIPEDTPSPDPEELPTPIVSAPVIALYHTHNSESFVPDSGQPHVYHDPEVTIVRVGLELARELERLGAFVIHSARDHVRPTYDQSYTRSLETAKSILATYPEIDYIFDIHRDALTKNLSTTVIDGMEVARVYIVVGTNESMNHPQWRENYAYAVALQSTFDELYPGFSRGILLRPLGRYNQHVHPRALLIEIGGHENTMEEAVRATRYLAQCIVTLHEKRSPTVP